MAKKKSETEKTETEKTETELPTSLFGEWVTPENMAKMANVESGFFPMKLSLSNATSSDLAIAELGVSLLPYEQDREIVINNQGALDTFCNNYAYWAELWQWNEHNGLIIRATSNQENQE